MLSRIIESFSKSNIKVVRDGRDNKLTIKKKERKNLTEIYPYRGILDYPKAAFLPHFSFYF